VDVQTVEQLNELPEGSKGLIWLNEGEGVTQSFIDKVTPFIGNPKLYGFFLVDEPDPTGKYHTQVDAADLRAESDYIHSNVPGAKTFITLMDMGSAANPDYSNTYNYANTHIDLFGLDPYPVRTGTSTVDYDMIDRSVAAAVASGIPISQIVPVYQTFGGGNWTTNTGGKYVMPTTDQLQTMMDHWEKLVPNPAFDFAYAWGEQEGDTALEHSPTLQAFFREHNLSDAGTPTAPTTPTTPSSTDTGDSGSTVTAPSRADTSNSKATAATSAHVDTSDSSSTATAPSHPKANHDSHITDGGDGFRAFASTDRMGGDHGGNHNYQVDKASGGSSVDRTLAALSQSFSDGWGNSHANANRADRTAANLADDGVLPHCPWQG
ncbi:hypothetical protein, partial [Mesorhizobium sanjuanii]|uniref:hypothetical protein n=1 Tax=Mesorhizobium sanjuanii TaxID=2037900 RepID=UPI001FE14C97